MLKILFNAGAKMDQKQFERAGNFAEKNVHFATKKYLGTLYLEFLSQLPPELPFLENDPVYEDWSLEFDEFN